MSAFDRYGQLPTALPDLLSEIAAPRVPDYTDDVLAITAVTRQRPRWTFLERWLPMIIARRRPAVPVIPWRFVTALIAILAIVAASLFLAGSQRHVPPPFGPARNGVLAYDSGGDIYVRDGLDGQSRAVVTGATDDFAAGFTRNGQHLTFLRRTAGHEGSKDERIDAFIANLDGSDAVDLTGPLIAPNWMDLSPDDSTLVVHAADPTQPSFMTDDGRSKLYVADVRHPGLVRPLVLPLAAATVPSFRGPDGSEIVFRGRVLVDAQTRSAIYAVHLDGSGLRALTPLDGDVNSGYEQPLLSQDGRFVTYTSWSEAQSKLRIHLLDLITGQDRTLTDDPTVDEGYAAFSPDGTRLVFIRYGDNLEQAMVGPVGVTSKAVAAGPRYAMVNGQYLTSSFSPDGASVIVNDTASKETRIVDAATGGAGQVLPWSNIGFGWQRLAP